ncbi:MAG: tetratricopeptide repeat protein [Saprospiraceae bacterium]|nr:tetratricopeptide repeat protein [Saprospiraceae bacterium]MDW8483747.1 tetratricopeptide repeat protein [Saprospiraceae bacterium]
MAFSRKNILTLLVIGLTGWAAAQQTTIYTEANAAYKRGIDFYNLRLYGLAQKEFREAMDLLRPVNEPDWIALKTDAALQFAKCAVRMEHPEAEKLVFDILRSQAPSPEASQAALEIGNYYFDNKKYDQAIAYYDMAPKEAPSSLVRDEIRFKQGYSYFVTKRFAQAKSVFASLRENPRSPWYYAANYYYGSCAYLEGRYDEAASAFRRCEDSPEYGKSIPYHLTQVFFAQKKYDQVIAYGSTKAQDDKIRNRAELNQLVGRAYFEKGDFKRALPYLEFAAKEGAPMTSADFYQLGYAQYQAGFYQQAIVNFEAQTKYDRNNAMGQSGLYHLADCYLRTNNKFAARTAFGQAAALDFNPAIKEDAQINYAKLSIELKFDRDALVALQSIPPGSRHYEDAQALLGEMFLSTRDYERAITTLEKISNRTARLNEIYQQVTYLRGLQLYQNNQIEEARRMFNKSLETPTNKRIAALCSFWLGAIANEKGEYNFSKNHLASFLTQARNYNDLPEESSLYMANYIQGYNLMKLNDFTGALTHFKAAVEGIKRELRNIQSDQIKTAVLTDAILRAGDCHFKRNQYREALAYYNEAIERKNDGFEYALYQKAIIKGLTGAPLDKIIALEDLVSKYPNSRFADDALFQIGDTYMELGRLEQALSAFRRIVSEYRNRSALVNRSLLKLGLISYNQGNSSAAINYYKQVMANNPEPNEAKDALAALEEIYVRDLNRPDEYFAFLNTVPGYSVTSAAKDSVTFLAAEVQYQNGRYQQAIDGFTNYLAQFPNGRYVLQAYFLRAESYAHRSINKPDLARKDYAYVVSKGPSRFYTRAAEKAALLAFQAQQYSEALDFARKWEESATSEASRFEAQVLLMRTAYATKNYSTLNEYAQKVANASMASAEQLATANYYLGKMAYDNGDLVRARPYLERVTQTSTTEIMAESYHLLAQILYRQRQYRQAEDLIINANQASAGYDDWIARNLILLSDVYLAQNDKSSAAAALEAVLDNYKGDPQILQEARIKYNQLNFRPNQQPRGIRSPDVIDFEGGN